jgi:hypothetical protein
LGPQDGEACGPNHLGENMSKSEHPASKRVRDGIEVLHLMMRSCESCRQAPYEFLIYESFVCTSCAEVAR